MSKVTYLVELYKKSVKELTKDDTAWKELLSAMARYYKRSFDNAVLIHVQKPDATQLATFDEWHDEKINRSINKGAKGLAIIDMQNTKASFKHLFDLMDTNGSVESFKKVIRYIWELEDQYKPSLLIKFHDKYGVSTNSMERSIYELVVQKVSQTLPQYMENFKVQDEGSMLYDMPIEAVKQKFVELVWDSTYYMIAQKCGLSTEGITDNSFENISHFDSLELFMAIGSHTMRIARPILREISQEIENIKNERSKVYEQRTIGEPNLFRGQGRTAVSESGNFGQRANSGGQTIRKTLEELHDGEPSTPIVGIGSTGQNQSNDRESRRGSGEPQGAIDTEVVTRTADAKHRGYTGESGTHGNDNPHSGGNHSQRSGVQNQINEKNEDKPSVDRAEKLSTDGFFVLPKSKVELQKEQREQKENSPQYQFSKLDEEEISDLVDVFLCADDVMDHNLKVSKEIYSFFSDYGHNLAAKASVLRDFYGNMDIDYTTKFGECVSVKVNDMELVFSIRNQEYSYTFLELADKIDNLILNGSYPFSSSDMVIDGYSIPDEIYEMQGAAIDDSFEMIDEVTKTIAPVTEEFSLEPFIMVEEPTKSYQDLFKNETPTKHLNFFSSEITQEIEPYQDISSEDKDGIITENSRVEPIYLSDEGDEVRRNYRYYPEHNLYEGGAKTKCKNNIEAIRLLKELQTQHRMATADEQRILAKYVGWGGFANALTPNKSGWQEEYHKIKSILSAEEFKSAQESTTTAYYTEQTIIENIYKALDRFGFQGGNILDPAMGTGNFFSVLPDSMRNSKLYGVELDRVTGAIAKQLYPAAEIDIKGFEETNYADQFFDVAIGNIPFNNIHVSDSKYDKYNFKIHDYFIAKTLDKVRPGGIIAFITTKGTMDKANQSVRRYMAQRAELVGAIRLPNNAFKAVAGTAVTADIIFLQKRERDIVPIEETCPWLSIEENEDGIPVNSYFIEHPEMVLGKMVYDESMYGSETTTACHPIEGDNLADRLDQAVYYLDGKYQEPTSEFEDEKEVLRDSIPADSTVKNFSYTIVKDDIYYRENSRMYQQDIVGKKAERIKGLIEIHHAIRSIIDFQTDDYNREHLEQHVYEQNLQDKIDWLNKVYDEFTKDFGYINASANVSAFSHDGAAPLLRSIEIERKDEKGIYDKTAIFYKATIHKRSMPKVARTADEALKICLNTKGRLDLNYMSRLYQREDHRKATQQEIVEELGDNIYQDPDRYTGDFYTGWVTADEYLSGYVKDKLVTAILKAEDEPERFTRNVEALKEVQPVPLTPQEISFTLGSTWIPAEIYQHFMYDVFRTGKYNQGYNGIEVEFSEYSGAYHISRKSGEKDSVTVNKAYGTNRMNAYEILEDTLNLKNVEVKDRVDYVDPNSGEDKVKYVLNKNDTILAREKQAQIKMEFESWLFSDPERGTVLTKLYNDRFNNIRPREYNGDDLILPDMTDQITLRKHQRDAIAHGLYGDGNLLMAHEVGAGKTYSAIATGYELKRLGAINKPLYAVPNHLVGQWAKEYMILYPNSNILVAEKKDFERKNRRRFASRIAVGDYDAIIMAHSSFELIGLSRERQLSAMEEELSAITGAIDSMKRKQGKDWSLKQMVMFQRNLQYRYDRLFKAEKKDNVINFEELGVDALIVDEAHAYKNNFSYTKLRNVAGISSSSSQRAMDMHMKAQYINQQNNGRGVIYLTGTPVSNSISEMYVMQKTLQPQELAKRNLLMFDSWASTFGKIESSLEIKPEGNGYQMKNRFARFHNLPELMSMFRMVADIKTADMLDLPVPKLKTGGFQVIKTEITPVQKDIVLEQGERAENIRNGKVSSSEDNFLKLTFEARLNAIDSRAIDPNLPYDPNTKLNVCAKNVADIYHETVYKKLTQIIFCDQGTPKEDGSFNFYDATKQELIKHGVKESEIAYIHDAKTDLQRTQLFDKVKSGEIRVLMGSTSKMGTGVNVQDKLVAVHHLDIPWRPADLTQRNGRILRQGNENEEVSIFNYITENTFDAYLWQILEQKQRYIAQIMTGRSALRSCDDIDSTVLQYAEFKALAISDPRIKEKMQVDNELSRLTVLKSSWKTQQNDMQYKVSKYYPKQIESTERKIEKTAMDIETYEKSKPVEFQMEISGRIHTERTRAAEHFRIMAKKLTFHTGDTVNVGTYAGFRVSVMRTFGDGIDICLKGNREYHTEMGESELGAITRMENLADRIPKVKVDNEKELESFKNQLVAAVEELEKPFVNEDRMKELQKRKVELDLALEFKQDGSDDIIAEDGSEESVATGTEPQNQPTTLEQKLFHKIYPFMKQIIDEEAYYIKHKSGGLEDFIIESIGGGEYSVAHYYEKNGDLMRDPEITFTIDKENKSIHPTSYLQDDMGIFYVTEDRSPSQVRDLESFMVQWFTHVKNQGYEPDIVKTNEEENEDEVEHESDFER